jgi:serine/threonine protein kinase
MENYLKKERIGRGTFGDVILVERISDKRVSNQKLYIPDYLVVCHEASPVRVAGREGVERC